MLRGTFQEVGGARHYLVKPETTSAKAVVLIHEWWGLTDQMKSLAEQYAKEGYLALAVDLFDGKSTQDPNVAAQWMASCDPKRALTKLRDALLWLQDGPLKIPRVATIGWCFGGGFSLKCALEMPELVQAGVIFYGLVETDEKKLKKCTVPLLGIFAEKDSWITPAKFRGFERACREAGVSLEMHVYDAEHAFHNPKNPQHQAMDALDADKKVFEFLRKTL